MKIKIKNFVFAGFAAAMFAGAAYADPVDTTAQPYDLDNEHNLNYVTSKKYVDRVVTNANAATTALAGRVSEAEADIDALQTNAEVKTNKAADLAAVTSASDLANKYPNVGAVKNALEGKQDTLTFDSTPTSASTNPVTSGGVYTAIQNINTDVSGKVNTAQGQANANKYLQVNASGDLELQSMDATPTQNSEKAVKSGGVYTALAGKQDTLTFDSTPTDRSNNPVKSGGVFDALGLKLDASDAVATAGNYIDAGTTVGSNLNALDTQVKSNADAIADNASAITTLQGQAANISGKQDKTDSAVSSTDATSAATGGLLTAGQAVGANLVSVATQATTNKNNISTINTTLSGYGDVVTHDASEFATAAQGTTADNTAATVATYGDIVTHNASEFATAAQGTTADTTAATVATYGNIVTHNVSEFAAAGETTTALAGKQPISTANLTVGTSGGDWTSIAYNVQNNNPNNCSAQAPCAWINNEWVPIQQ